MTKIDNSAELSDLEKRMFSDAYEMQLKKPYLV